MSNNSSDNQYPTSTAPIAEIFGFNKPKSDHSASDSSHGDVAHETPAQIENAHEDHNAVASHVAPPQNLPTLAHEDLHPQTSENTGKPSGSEPHLTDSMKAKLAAAHDDTSHEPAPAMPTSVKKVMWQKIVTGALPYIGIFAVGLITYFYFFNKVDISSWFKSSTKQTVVTTPKDTQLEALEKQNAAAYSQWINGFYYDVSDKNVLDPNADNSGNGLTNFQKFLLNLNPKSYSTLGLGKSDTALLSEGINPLTGNPLTDKQKDIINKYFDMEVIMNKLTVNGIKNQGAVAGTSISATGYTSPLGDAGIAPRGSIPGTQPINNPPAQINVPSNEVDINYDIPGRLEIPDLGVNAPLIWTKDPKNFDTDLKSGVVHYPGTAVPGQIGTTYISGHSSNYVWVKSDYNHIFTHLDKLADYASFKITVVQKNGKDAIFHYVVKSRKEFQPDDQAQFQNGATSTVALSTCWPVGSTAKRLVVFGELTQVEK